MKVSVAIGVETFDVVGEIKLTCVSVGRGDEGGVFWFVGGTVDTLNFCIIVAWHDTRIIIVKEIKIQIQ